VRNEIKASHAIPQPTFSLNFSFLFTSSHRSDVDETIPTMTAEGNATAPSPPDEQSTSKAIDGKNTPAKAKPRRISRRKKEKAPPVDPILLEKTVNQPPESLHL
jgi:hypothetical protein